MGEKKARKFRGQVFHECYDAGVKRNFAPHDATNCCDDENGGIAVRFQLENIGAIEKADIDIDGITDLYDALSAPLEDKVEVGRLPAIF